LGKNLEKEPMAARRLSMRNIRETLRLKWISGCSERQISESCKIARSTVNEYLKRAEEAGLSWPRASELDDTVLEHLLYPPKPQEGSGCAPMPPMDYLYRDLRRKGAAQ
jgi:hypothetical protein